MACAQIRTIALGSADSAIEGRHYYRRVRIHKEMFCALVQHKIEDVTESYQKMNGPLKQLIVELKSNPCEKKDQCDFRKP